MEKKGRKHEERSLGIREHWEIALEKGRKGASLLFCTPMHPKNDKEEMAT